MEGGGSNVYKDLLFMLKGHFQPAYCRAYKHKMRRPLPRPGSAACQAPGGEGQGARGRDQGRAGCPPQGGGGGRETVMCAYLAGMRVVFVTSDVCLLGWNEGRLRVRFGG